MTSIDTFRVEVQSVYRGRNSVSGTEGVWTCKDLVRALQEQHSPLEEGGGKYPWRC